MELSVATWTPKEYGMAKKVLLLACLLLRASRSGEPMSLSIEDVLNVSNPLKIIRISTILPHVTRPDHTRLFLPITQFIYRIFSSQKRFSAK